MSGFEIFGAAAASLVLAQQIVGSLRWGKEEYDTWKCAGQEMKELLTYAEYTSIHLEQVKAKLANTAVQRALDRDSTWKNAAKHTLDTSHSLFIQIQAYLPPEAEINTNRQGFVRKLMNSAQSGKTRNFSTRITRLNTLLTELRDSLPLQAKQAQSYSNAESTEPPESAAEAAVVVMGFWMARTDREYTINHGDRLVQRGDVRNGWAEVRFDFRSDPGDSRQAWKWVPADHVIQLH